MRKLIRTIPAIALIVLASACAAGATDPLADDVLNGGNIDEFGQIHDTQEQQDNRGQTKAEP